MNSLKLLYKTYAPKRFRWSIKMYTWWYSPASALQLAGKRHLKKIWKKNLKKKNNNELSKLYHVNGLYMS